MAPPPNLASAPPLRGYSAGSAPGGGPPHHNPHTTEPSGLQVVVHNLPWNVGWQQLKEHFREWPVERADVVADAWGKSRGFGTVRFFDRRDAEAACSKLNNTEIEGRTITVRLDRFA
jgi:RNA recognition motif-containing protein